MLRTREPRPLQTVTEPSDVFTAHSALVTAVQQNTPLRLTVSHVHRRSVSPQLAKARVLPSGLKATPLTALRLVR